MFDFTFDLFVADVQRYAAIPKGVYDNGKDPRKAFVRSLKAYMELFMAYWMLKYGKLYSREAGYAGDAFAAKLQDWPFSSLYKDAYGQRPHLNMWYYVHALGLPMSEDVARTFCASPIEEAEANAKYNREH